MAVTADMDIKKATDVLRIKAGTLKVIWDVLIKVIWDVVFSFDTEL